MRQTPDILLSFKRALLGRVTPRLRAVCVDASSVSFVFRAVFDGEIGDVDEEQMQDAEAEVIADHPEYDGRFQLELIRYDAPQPLKLQRVGDWVYIRAETPPSELASAPDAGELEDLGRAAATPDGAATEIVEAATPKESFRVRLLLALQRALLGHVTSRLRQIVLRLPANSSVELTAIFDREIGDEDQLHLHAVSSALLCTCCLGALDLRLVRLDAPISFSAAPDAEVVFLRYEGS